MSGIQGVNVAALTPRGKQGDADFGAALELIDFVCRSGAQGIALLGSTGEFASLSFDERTRLAYLVTKRSRVPVLVGVGHPTLDGAVALAREAISAGAAGLLAMPPHFFRYDQDDIREFYLQLAAQVGKSGSIYLYNIPFFASELAAETAVELLETGQFAGIKDSSGCFEYYEKLRAAREQRPFTILIGNDNLFARARGAGADGVVSGCACAVPELLVALDRAILAGARERAQRLNLLLFEFISWIDRFPAPVGIRLAAAQRDVQVGPLSVPLPPGKVRLADEFREWFRGWLPAVRNEAAAA